eukprot:Tamp_25908.p1 GENE.Tamp_25908~~Tamp_25908.p1  ORF type:complete len:212 (+),score=21.79 Tamp_25908:195-830(+)
MKKNSTFFSEKKFPLGRGHFFFLSDIGLLSGTRTWPSWLQNLVPLLSCSFDCLFLYFLGPSVSWFSKKNKKNPFVLFRVCHGTQIGETLSNYFQIRETLSSYFQIGATLPIYLHPAVCLFFKCICHYFVKTKFLTHKTKFLTQIGETLPMHPAVCLQEEGDSVDFWEISSTVWPCPHDSHHPCATCLAENPSLAKRIKEEEEEEEVDRERA